MRIRELLDIGATATLVVCAIAATTLFVRRELYAAKPNAALETDVQEWRSYTLNGIRAGADNAPVTIVEFSDFQCPFCAKLYHSLERMRSKYQDDIAIVFRHVPIASLHPHAKNAALASECAASVGKFDAYKSLLFTRQDSIGLVPWTILAERAGVTDTAAFSVCMASDATAERLKEDSTAAAKLGVNGTPTMLVNNIRIVGAPSDSALDEAIQNALRDQRRR